MVISGCCQKRVTRVEIDAPRPLGTQLDEILEAQELNAEASKYVIYEHEFKLPEYTDDGVTGGWRLNEFGEDHVKQIAANLNRGDHFPVVIERSRISPDPESRFKFAIHYNEDLDLRRRAVIVAALHTMGVVDAEERVVIAPAFAEGVSAQEAMRAYTRSQGRGGRGGFGGGGVGGGGGLGGFGF